MEQKHKRRPHYSGKYPRRFEEKYKEQNPEKYGDTIEHVISKGSTPAGMHIPIMVDEILEFLQIKPGEIGLDCTLGYGGHSLRMLQALSSQTQNAEMSADSMTCMSSSTEISEADEKKERGVAHGAGHLYALDVDPIEIVKTRERLKEKGYGEEIFTAIRTNFRNIDEVAEKYGPFDFVLADLGVSSMQIDNPERGFSYKTDGPLDMRLDPSRGESAAQRLATLSETEIASMLYENSDEPYAAEIAKAVAEVYRRGGKIETTGELREVVKKAVVRIPAKKLVEESREDAIKKAYARTFQALRIDVNSEMEVLYEFLEKLPGAVREGGRICILTFHSGEDRLVKKAFKAGLRDGLYSYASKDVIRPSKEECFRNPRARSTKLRCAMKA
jgi:16S rRNA (cytosine1402-N4)-methyltransferase